LEGEVGVEIHLITIPSVEAAGTSGTGAGTYGAAKIGGLAAASEAYLKAGLVDNLKQEGVEVTEIDKVSLTDGEASGDRITDLGRLGAKIADAVAGAIEAKARPVLAGGTCSHLPGMLAGVQRAYGPAAKIGLIWFDAHGDFNTPKTSYTGMLGGMPVAVAAGLCHPVWREGAGMSGPLPTGRIAFVDIRNLDDREQALIEATDARVGQLVDHKAGPRAEEVIGQLADEVDHLYLHIDADVLDKHLQPNHPTAEPDGADLERTLAAIAAAMGTGKVRAYGVVSVNPNGEGGETSLKSGMALLERGIGAWKGQ
jgi:arginase